MADSFYPLAYGGGRIDFSPLADIGTSIGSAIRGYRDKNELQNLVAQAGGDYNKLVQGLLSAGRTKEAGVVADYALAKSQQDATNAYRTEDLQLRRDALNQPPDAVRTAQAFAENPNLATATPSPANVKATRDAQVQLQGKQNLSRVLGRATDVINELRSSGGMVSPGAGVVNNVGAWLGATEKGQELGAALGTENQSLRKRMMNMRTVISNLVRQASGMSARAFDSNYELQTYLNSIGDPKGDDISNLVAIDVLDQTFGLGGLLDGKLDQGTLQKVRAGSAQAIQQNPIKITDVDKENPDVTPAPAPDAAVADPRGAYFPDQGQPQGMNRQAAPEGTIISNGDKTLVKKNGQWVPMQ